VTYTHRPYRDTTDIQLMKRVSAQAFARVACHPQAGIEWIVFGPSGFPPDEIVRIWDDARGEPVGWAVFQSVDGFDYRILPDVAGSPLEEEMVDWGIDGTRAWRKANGLDDRCVVECWGGDHSRTAILTELGFTRGEVIGVVFSQSLDRVIPEPRLPDGWHVGGLDDDALIDSRATTQYEAFSPGSHTTPDTWRRMMKNAPGYDRDFDNVAISPEGEVCAAALAWLDNESLTGEFEPVGTRPAQQQRGLGKAVLLRGLAKMQQRGMTTAIVGTNATNAAAIALYESVGFRIVNRNTEYRRESS